MSKTEVSPGPWEAQDMFKNWLIVDCNDIIIDIRGNEANAKLIAAAPDMYQALCELESYLSFSEKIEDGDKQVFENASGINEAFRKAMESLAKAEGGKRDEQQRN